MSTIKDFLTKFAENLLCWDSTPPFVKFFGEDDMLNYFTLLVIVLSHIFLFCILWDMRKRANRQIENEILNEMQGVFNEISAPSEERPHPHRMPRRNFRRQMQYQLQRISLPHYGLDVNAQRRIYSCPAVFTNYQPHIWRRLPRRPIRLIIQERCREALGADREIEPNQSSTM